MRYSNQRHQPEKINHFWFPRLVVSWLAACIYVALIIAVKAQTATPPSAQPPSASQEIAQSIGILTIQNANIREQLQQAFTDRDRAMAQVSELAGRVKDLQEQLVAAGIKPEKKE